MLIIYRSLINLLLLISPIILILRILKGKEDSSRFFEKYGFSSLEKNRNNLIWFHGSSVGEILSVIPIIEKIEKEKKNTQILITSNTLSSSKVLKKYNFKRTFHQFLPIDSNIIVKKFLNHWEPNLVIFIESERNVSARSFIMLVLFLFIDDLFVPIEFCLPIKVTRSSCNLLLVIGLSSFP